MRTLFISALVFFFASGTAFAAPRLDPSQAEFTHGPAIMPVGSISGSGSTQTQGGPPMLDSAHASMGTHSGTWPVPTVPGRDGHMMGTTTPPMLHGLPGVVTSVTPAAFLIALPSGKDHATTTFTVTVSSATKFSHGSTTASLSDVTVGAHIEVLGKVSSSTKSITAERVMILPPMAVDPGPKPSIFTRIKAVLFGSHAAISTEQGGPAAAAASGGFFGTLLNALMNLF